MSGSPVVTLADLAGRTDSVVATERGTRCDRPPLLASMSAGFALLLPTGRLRIHDDEGTRLAEHPVGIPDHVPGSTRQLVHWDGALHLVDTVLVTDTGATQVTLHRLGPDAPVLDGVLTLHGAFVSPYVRDGRLRLVVALSPLVIHEVVDGEHHDELGRWDAAPVLRALTAVAAGRVVADGVLFLAEQRAEHAAVHRFVHIDDDDGAIRVSDRFELGPTVGGIVVRDDELLLSHLDDDGVAWLTMAPLRPILDGMGPLDW